VLLLTLPKNGHTSYFRRELQNNFVCDLPWNHFHAEYQGCYCNTVRLQHVCRNTVLYITITVLDIARHATFCEVALLSSSDVCCCPNG